jgi:hypothetical protein
VDHFLKAQQFVSGTHRDVYAAIEPQQSSLSQKGKVVVVTGASQGLGARVSSSQSRVVRFFIGLSQPCL